MKGEIEFLPVGDASKAGDAIIVRYGEPNAYYLMLIDGGHAETGEAIVRRLHAQFGSSAFLQHVVLTHSDGDHASGLRTVLQKIRVQNLWLHMPWDLADASRGLFANKRGVPGSLRDGIKAAYPIVSEIVDLARAQGTKLHYPWAGGSIGPFWILSPSFHVYQHLLPQFDRTPAPDEAAIRAARMWLGKMSPDQRAAEAAKAQSQRWTDETWDRELLRDGGLTSASNETSVVLYGVFEAGPVLLTADAGINALTWAAAQARAKGLPLQQFKFVQIPHHGSRRNVGPTILNHLLGPAQPQGGPIRFDAFVSAPRDDEAHPRAIVLNAFLRRGGRVTATQGAASLYYGGFPQRSGYSAARGVGFASRVEEYT